MILLVCSAALAWLAFPTTFPAADYHVYRRAARDLATLGDPYASNPGAWVESRYRYPPLLAVIVPGMGTVWFGLLGLATALPIWLRFRRQGLVGLELPLLMVGLWVQQLVNGNAQALVVAALALVPLYRRAGAAALAFASWLKIYPLLGVVYYVGRKDWIALKYFTASFVVLGAVQTPWLPEFVGYVRSQALPESLPTGLSLRGFGLVPWLLTIGVLACVAVWRAAKPEGWTWAIVLQLFSLPRLLAVHLPILLAAPVGLPSVHTARMMQRKVLGGIRTVVGTLNALPLGHRGSRRRGTSAEVGDEGAEASDAVEAIR